MIEIKEYPNAGAKDYFEISEQDGLHFMLAKDKDEVLGAGIFSVNGDTAIFIDAKEMASGMLHGMGKAMLNSMDLSGVRIVTSANENLEALFRTLKFRQAENGSYYLYLDGYFDKKGGCCG